MRGRANGLAANAGGGIRASVIASSWRRHEGLGLLGAASIVWSAWICGRSAARRYRRIGCPSSAPRRRSAGIPVTYVPARNNVSGGWRCHAERWQRPTFPGMNAIDYSGYRMTARVVAPRGAGARGARGRREGAEYRVPRRSWRSTRTPSRLGPRSAWLFAHLPARPAGRRRACGGWRRGPLPPQGVRRGGRRRSDAQAMPRGAEEGKVEVAHQVLP